MTGTPTGRRILGDIWGALAGDPARHGAVRFDGEGRLTSAFAVSDLAAGRKTWVFTHATKFGATKFGATKFGSVNVRRGC
jgi:hypothetical protein